MFKLPASSDSNVANLSAVPVCEPKYILSSGMFDSLWKGYRVLLGDFMHCLNGLLD